jgi:hypothetical protein
MLNNKIILSFLFNDGGAKVFVTKYHRKVILVSKPVKKQHLPVVENEIWAATL